MMSSKFDQAAFAMKVGEISEPIESKVGYQIIKLNRHEAKRDKTYQEAKKEIIENIKKDYIETRINDYYEQVKTGNKMQVNEQELNQFSEKKLNQIKRQEASIDQQGEQAAK